MRGGDSMVGMVFKVETAGALVSPLMSAPRPLDRRRARGILSLERGRVMSCLGRSRGERSGKASRVVADMVGEWCLLFGVRLPCCDLVVCGSVKMKLSCRDGSWYMCGRRLYTRYTATSELKGRYV